MFYKVYLTYSDGIHARYITCITKACDLEDAEENVRRAYRNCSIERVEPWHFKGTDIIEVERIKNAMENEKFILRVFTDKEIENCVHSAYTSNFDDNNPAPISNIGDNTYIENCIVESRDTIRANSYFKGEGDVKIVLEKNERYVF